MKMIFNFLDSFDDFHYDGEEVSKKIWRPSWLFEEKVTYLNIILKQLIKNYQNCGSSDWVTKRKKLTKEHFIPYEYQKLEALSIVHAKVRISIYNYLY